MRDNENKCLEAARNQYKRNRNAGGTLQQQLQDGEAMWEEKEEGEIYENLRNDLIAPK